jgi:hypothetical protein
VLDHRSRITDSFYDAVTWGLFKSVDSLDATEYRAMSIADRGEKVFSNPVFYGINE